MADEFNTEGEDDGQEFLTIWQRRPVKIALTVGIGLAIIVGLYLAGIADWAADQTRDLFGQARYAQLGFEEEFLDPSPIGDVHAETLPEYMAAFIRSGDPTQDPRVDELLRRLKQGVDDEELAAIADDWHQALLEEQADLSEFEHQWNARLVALDEPYAVRGGAMTDHGHRQYMPETYRIVDTVEVIVDDRSHSVQWRHRLDHFRRAAEPTFYDADSDAAWVRSDRGWLTIWRTLLPLLLSADERQQAELPEGTDDFGWRQSLRDELRQWLGGDHFAALLDRAITAEKMRVIAGDVADRGNRCGQNFRIARIPWLGFDSDEIDRFTGLADADRYAECPRMTTDEAHQLRRLSRALQSDLTYQEAMPRLLAGLLAHKSIMAAAHRHRLTASDDATICEECRQFSESMSNDDAAEIGGYLTATTSGPLPQLGLFRTCFDHRYGSRASYRGWLLLLRQVGFDCRGQWPTDLIDDLQEFESTQFLPIDDIRIAERPEIAPIYRRD